MRPKFDLSQISRLQVEDGRRLAAGQPSIANRLEEFIAQLERETLTPPADGAPIVPEVEYIKIPLGTKLKEIERLMMVHALEETGWNKQQAAKDVGISRRAFYNKLERYKITRRAA